MAKSGAPPLLSPHPLTASSVAAASKAPSLRAVMTSPSSVAEARGSVSVNGTRLDAGDAAEWTGEPTIRFEQGSNAEVLLFDLN